MPCLTPSSPRRSGSSEVGGKWATKSSAYTSAIGPTSPVFQSSCSLRMRRLWFTPSSAGTASSARRFGETRGLQAKLHDRNIEPAIVLPGDLPLDADDHEAVARVEAERRRVRYLLPPALRRFRSRYPRTELTVVTGNAPEIARAVVGCLLDVGIVSLPVRERELAVSPFYRDEVVAIAPPDRRWRRGQRAAARDLVSAPLILFERGATLRRVIDDWFRRAGEVPVSAMELGNTEAIKKLVEAGLGLSVTSWFSVAAEVRRRKLAAARLDPPLYREIGVILRRDKPQTPVLEAFLATLAGLRRSLE